MIRTIRKVNEHTVEDVNSVVSKMCKFIIDFDQLLLTYMRAYIYTYQHTLHTSQVYRVHNNVRIGQIILLLCGKLNISRDPANFCLTSAKVRRVWSVGEYTPHPHSYFDAYMHTCVRTWIQMDTYSVFCDTYLHLHALREDWDVHAHSAHVFFHLHTNCVHCRAFCWTTTSLWQITV